MDARRKAELFARRLDVARKQEEDDENNAAIEPSPQWSTFLELKQKSNVRSSKEFEHPLAQPQVVADQLSQPQQTMSSFIAEQQHASQGTTSVASLEMLIKAQQRDLIKADTDLRVSMARNRALQQKVDDLGRLVTELQRAAERPSSSNAVNSDRDAALHEIQMQSLKSTEYARDLELRLQYSEATCRELQRRLAVAEAAVRNSADSISICDPHAQGDNKSMYSSESIFNRIEEFAGGKKVQMAQRVDSSELALTSTSSILQDASLRPPTSTGEPVVTAGKGDDKKAKKKNRESGCMSSTTLPPRSHNRAVMTSKGTYSDTHRAPSASRRPHSASNTDSQVRNGKSGATGSKGSGSGRGIGGSDREVQSTLRKSIKIVLPSGNSTKPISASSTAAKGHKSGVLERKGASGRDLINLSLESSDMPPRKTFR